MTATALFLYFLKDFLFIYECMSVLRVCHVYADVCGSQRGDRSPGAGVRGDCELPEVVIGTELASLREVSTLNH